MAPGTRRAVTLHPTLNRRGPPPGKTTTFLRKGPWSLSLFLTDLAVTVTLASTPVDLAVSCGPKAVTDLTHVPYSSKDNCFSHTGKQQSQVPKNCRRAINKLGVIPPPHETLEPHRQPI